MAKLLTIGGKLRHVGGSLVTDADGSPCCCEETPPNGPRCDCAAGGQPIMLRTYPCVNGRAPLTWSAETGPFKIITTSVSWRFESEQFVRSIDASRIVHTYAGYAFYSGNATWCSFENTGNGGAVLLDARSSWEYFTAGSDEEYVRLDGSESGRNALLFPPVHDSSPAAFVIGQTNFFRMTGDIRLLFSTLTFENGDFRGRAGIRDYREYLRECNFDRTVQSHEDAPHPGTGAFDLTNSLYVRYNDIPDDSSFNMRRSMNQTDTRYTSAGNHMSGVLESRATNAAQIAWSHDGQRCDGTDTGARPAGGCDGCGDRSALEPMP